MLTIWKGDRMYQCMTVCRYTLVQLTKTNYICLYSVYMPTMMKDHSEITPKKNQQHKATDQIAIDIHKLKNLLRRMPVT